MKVFLKLLVVLWALASLEDVTSDGVQPLSVIAIEKAVIALDNKAYIKASPSVLGFNVSLEFKWLCYCAIFTERLSDAIIWHLLLALL